jgi:uncharacterized protein
MVVLPEPLEFEWDRGNKDKNFIKHDVTAKEAEGVFKNKPLFVSKDLKHSSVEEERFQALGITDNERKLFVSFTVRKDRVRIISARDMSKKEEVKYEKIQNYS